MAIFLATMQKLVGQAISLESTMRTADLDPDAYNAAINGYGAAIDALNDLLKVEVDALDAIITASNPFLYPTVKYYGDFVALKITSGNHFIALKDYAAATESTESDPFTFIATILAGAPTAVGIRITGWVGSNSVDGEYSVTAATGSDLTIASGGVNDKTEASTLMIEIISITT